MSVRTRLSLWILFCLCSASPAAEPKLDRFGDPLPEDAIARLGSLDLRNEIPILTAAFTADGKTLATGDGVSIAFWDLATGKCVRRVPLKNAGSVQVRRLSNDGKILMLGDSHNVLHFLDAASGEEQRTLNLGQCGPIWGKTLELSRDGKILAAVHRGSITLWDVAGGKLLHEFKEPSLGKGPPPYDLIALTPDGKQLVLPHADGSLHLVDVASGKEVRAFEMPPPRQRLPPYLRLQRLVLSPDGRFLAFGGSAAPWTVCELTTGKRLRQLGPLQGSVAGPIFTPNGRFLAVDERNEVRLVGVLSGKEIRKLPKPASVGPSTKLVFSPDGRTLVGFPSGHIIHLWDVVAQRRLHPLIGHERGVKALAFFPDGKRLVSADQTGELRVWDLASCQTLARRTYNYGSASLTVDRDGETVRFAGNDSMAHQWNLRADRKELQQKVGDNRYTNLLALSPDGRSLAVQVFKSAAPQQRPGSPELRLYDVKTNESIVLPRSMEQGGVGYLTFTADSRRLAASCADGVLRLWNRDTGKLVREVPRVRLDGPPVHLDFAADGRSFVALMDRKVRIHEIASGADRLQIPPPHGIFALDYSLDARFLAFGGGDGRILIYSALSGKQLAQWQGKQGYVFALAFSRDRRLLASGGADGTILIWKVPEDDSVPVARNTEEADSFWQVLGDRDAATANRALAGLTAAPVQALPIFKERLPLLAKPQDQRLARLIAELDDDSFKVREQASRELALMGNKAADALRQALSSNPSAEAKRRMKDLLAHIKEDGPSERLRFLRAIEVLERIGSQEAKDLLRELAGKPMTDEFREEVQASLRRMGERTSETTDKAEPRP